MISSELGTFNTVAVACAVGVASHESSAVTITRKHVMFMETHTNATNERRGRVHNSKYMLFYDERESTDEGADGPFAYVWTALALNRP